MASAKIWTDNPKGPSSSIIPQAPITLGDAGHPFEAIYVKDIVVTGGTGGNAGTFTANGATSVVVPNTNVTADSSIQFGLKTVGGTPAPVFEFARTPGVSFTIRSTAGNTSVYNYTIIG